jgi:hypothetical protein
MAESWTFDVLVHWRRSVRREVLVCGKNGARETDHTEVCKHQESSAKCRRDCASWRCLLTTASRSAR